MKTKIALAIAVFLPFTSLRCADPSQVDTRGWLESDEKVKILQLMAHRTLANLQKDNFDFGQSQSKLPDLSDLRLTVGQSWLSTRHLTAILAVIVDELYMLPQITDKKQHAEFARCILAAASNLDTVLTDAEQMPGYLVRSGELKDQQETLLALRDDFKDANDFTRRLKNLPLDEK